MRNIAMTVSYDGTAYDGFQTQPSGNTIQDKLEEAIFQLTQERVKIIGSGRTDAGVHARGQVVNFHTKSRIPAERFYYAMNARLPNDIVVWQSGEVPAHFHARKGAKRKTYRYCILNSTHLDVLNRHQWLHVYRPLDIQAMQEAIGYLVGEHDFTSFCSARTQYENRVRTIYAATVQSSRHDFVADGNIVTIEVTGNGFLYNMVRIIAGTLISVGQGKMDSQQIERILAARDRSAAGPTAPAHGLKLWNVEYEDWPSRKRDFKEKSER